MKVCSPPNLQKGLETDKYKVALSEAHDQANDFNWLYLDYLEIGEIFRKKKPSRKSTFKETWVDLTQGR